MKSKWRKILYEDQGVPDNYVDETFLDEMKKNLYTRTYNFWSVVQGAGVVTQQISCVCLFVVMFIYMDRGYVGPGSVCGLSTTLTIFGYVANIFLNRQISEAKGRTFWDDTKTVMVFIAFGYGSTPVLATLTRTISTDTIYAMTVLMLLANLLFHDYGANAAMVSQSLSFNAAIFASVCLASRLPTRWHTFTTITCAMQIFALGPVLRRNLKTAMPRSDNVLTILLGLSAVISLATVSSVGAILFLILHIFVSFVCPLWLTKLQTYKNNIHGPWDEAVIKD